MIFPPVATTELCLHFTVCVRVCLCKQRPHAKGFHGRHPQVLWGVRVPWAMIALPVLSSQRKTLCLAQTWVCENTVMEAHTHTHTCEDSSSVQTTLLLFVCMQQCIYTNKQFGEGFHTHQPPPHSCENQSLLYNLSFLHFILTVRTYCAAVIVSQVQTKQLQMFCLFVFFKQSSLTTL